MIQVENLSKSYGSQVLFEDVSFTVNPGERVGLVGRNGHGKTTLFRLILGEEHPDSGRIRMPQGYVVGHLSQHIRFSADTALAEGCLGLPDAEEGRDETYRVKAVLAGLGFTEADFLRHPLELSGGYQIRLNLAKLLVSCPNILLLDEPTNYLDIVSIRWLTRFLRGWKNEVMIITHDRGFMDGVSTHTMGIHRQRIRKVAGPTEKLYGQLLLEEEHYEKTRLNDERKRQEAEGFIRRFRAQANRARAVQSRIKALKKMGERERLAGISALDFTFRSDEFHGKWLVDCRDARFSFDPGGPDLINGFTMSVARGDRIAVIGRNGKGKTTLLNLLAGEREPTDGAVLRAPRTTLAYFGQTNIDRLHAGNTVEEEILEAMPEHDRRTARGICGMMMFEGDDALKKIHVLSGGERSRVLLGKLLVRPANLLLLDEPTNHLDMESTEALLEALEEFAGAAVIVTHNEMILHSFPERLVVFDSGGIRIFEGVYRDFLERVGWDEESDGRAAPPAGRPEAVRDQSRKDIKRTRAELIDSRSRIVGVLERRITEIEDTISRLEQEIEGNNKALIAASEKGQWQSVASLSQANRSAGQSIERLFEELEDLTGELNLRSREFEEKLKALS